MPAEKPSDIARRLSGQGAAAPPSQTGADAATPPIESPASRARRLRQQGQGLGRQQDEMPAAGDGRADDYRPDLRLAERRPGPAPLPTPTSASELEELRQRLRVAIHEHSQESKRLEGLEQAATRAHTERTIASRVLQEAEQLLREAK